MLNSYNPFNNQVLREYQITSKQKLDEILLNTKEAREEWLNKDINQRSIAISKLSESIMTNLDEIATNIVSETGMPISEAYSSTKKLVDRIDFLCDKTPLFLEPEIHDLKDGRTNMITYNSIGTVSCIMPWNHPFILPFWSIVPALIAGNSVIYKPSELTPLVGETISKLFSDLELPDYLFSTVYGDGKLGRDISSSNGINMISFAGSVKVAKKVFAQASQNMKRLVLENGGKDALIIGEYDNKQEVASEVLKGAFRHAGQLCSSVRRVYILEKDLDDYLDLFKQEVTNYKVGNPFEPDTFVGPLKTKKQLGDLQDKLYDALNKNAKILFGNKIQDNFFYPTIVYQANEEMSVVNQEVFGPLLPIITVKDVSEAIQRANNSPFGLNASLWHNNSSEAINYANNLEVGTVTINAIPGTHNYCTWHGIKMSGIGNILSKDGIRQFTNRKNIRYQS